MSSATTTPLAPAADPSPTSPRASESGAANLPPELIAIIVSHTRSPREPTFCGNWVKKRGLTSLSLVCKQWYKTVVRSLFRDLLGLRGAKDLIDLRELLARERAPGFPPLDSLIFNVTVTISTAETEPWMVHLHWLTAQHQLSYYKVILENPSRYPPNPSPEDLRLAPFRALPRVPRTYVQFTGHLTLEGVLFKHLLELDQLLFDLPGHLFQVHLIHVSFANSSPTCRMQKTGRFLASLKSMYCEGVPLEDILTLGINRIRASPGVFTLNMSTWRQMCKALLALLPDADIANVDRLSDRDGCSIAGMEVATLFSRVKMFVIPPRPPLARGGGFLRGDGIDVWISLQQQPDEPELSWDLWKDIFENSTDRAKFDCLSILVNVEAPAPAKELLSLVLRRIQLKWALDSGKLRFLRGWDDTSITSEDIRASEHQHAIDGMTLTLDATEQAEWLLRYYPSDRCRYLRQLGRERYPDHSWEADPDEPWHEGAWHWRSEAWNVGAEDGMDAQEGEGAEEGERKVLSTATRWWRKLKLRQLDEMQISPSSLTGRGAGRGRALQGVV